MYRELYIPFWLYSNGASNVPGTIPSFFTFHSGYILMYLFEYNLNPITASLHSTLVSSIGYIFLIFQSASLLILTSTPDFSIGY